ncbi:MAG: hypothetical protein AABW71_05120 [Nanoarchaeota archaeon]
MMDQKQFEIICNKLDKIATVLATQSIEDKDDKIYHLKKAGLTSDEISPLIGIKNVRDTRGWKRK